MGGIWQSLKRKISRRHPGREPTSVDSKPEPARAAQQTDEPTNDTSEIETESNHVSTPNGLIENPADHGAEVQQANELGGPHPEIPLNPEQKALIDSLRVEYEDVEDDPSQYEEAVVVEYVDHETQIEAEPKIHLESPQNRLHIPTSGLISGHKVEAVPYSIQFPIPATISAPPDLNTVGVSNLEAGSDSAKRSYLSIIPTTIQAVTENTTLFVWHANFHPAIGRRFSSVRVACKFASAPGTPRVTPASLLAGVEVRAFAPHKSYGASSREQRKITWGLELPLTVPAGPVQVGVTPSGSRETSKEVEHAFTIEGSARGTPLRNSCVWTVQENASTERGIPSELQVCQNPPFLPIYFPPPSSQGMFRRCF